MAVNRRIRSSVPQTYPYYASQVPPWQQQPWDGQMGTRGAGGAQGQQPGGGFQGQQPGGGFQGGFQGQQPGGGFQGGFQGQQPGGEFQGGFQGQVGPQQGVGMTQPGEINPQEKMVLRGVLDILKECRVALTRGTGDEPDELMEQRQTAAQAYLSGFLEAKGQQEVGGYLSTIPPLSTRGVVDDGEYDDMIDDLEGLLSDESQTRGFWSVAAPIIWDAAKIAARSKTGQEIGRKVKGRLKRIF